MAGVDQLALLSDAARAALESRSVAGGSTALGYALAELPPLRNTRRNPDFWADLEVRQLVIECHRQMTIAQALALITSKVGGDRTPSKSALARAWIRLDRAKQPRRKGGR
jgi:hypothetical protein